MDDDENWNVDKDTDVMSVAAHELGHALGLPHSNDPEALMAPYYKGYDPDFKLSSDDVQAIQYLYG
jgi:matrix metalloproteinase-14 (membrane-inserted)